MTYTALHDGWTITALSGAAPADIFGRSIAATVPGVVHTDLLAAGLIAAPFDADNEAAQQWIGSTVWRYDADFTWSDRGEQRHDLVALGLDTVATVEINGIVVGSTQNQHRSYRFDLRPALIEGSNHLAITFAAPVDEAESRSVEHDPLPHTNHHPYNALRKMACNFGWDWGIDVATSGIWKAIGLESWSGVRIDSVRPLVGVDGTTGVLTAEVALEYAAGQAAGGATGAGSAVASALQLVATVGGATATVEVPTGATAVTAVVRVDDAKLWWPIGHGEQPLYDVAASVGSAGSAVPIDSWSGRVGFRTVELDIAPDDAGTPFIIKVNGEAVVIRGANWIPDHAFLTEIDRDRYAARIDDAVESNMNLLRVWGGGIYESDDFYAECDERGVLVWQDFLFACAAYAEEEWLAAEVEAEAREAITRLSAHASLVIWNGNNENIWGYVAWGWRPLLGDRTWGNGYYRELLPSLVAELDPTRPYSPGSPYSFSDYLHPNDEHNGTMHIWDVWNEKDYSVYADYRPRFVSEFGFQGPPVWSTLVDVVHDEPLDPYGHEMLVHQKAYEGNRKLERGLVGHLPEPLTIEDWHWSTQLNQAHAVRFGIEHFRSLMPHNMGTIVWQLNDNWPVVSWAAVDFSGQRKPLWYALRAAYRPRLATIQPREGGLALVLANDDSSAWTGPVVLRRLAFDGTVLAEETVTAAVDARSAATIALPAALAVPDDAAGEVSVAEFRDGSFNRAEWNFVEVIDQRLDAAALRTSAVPIDDGYVVSVTALCYARDVTLQVDRVDREARVDNAMVTLLAGESTQFLVTSAAVFAPEELLAPLALRHAGDLRTAITA